MRCFQLPKTHLSPFTLAVVLTIACSGILAAASDVPLPVMREELAGIFQTETAQPETEFRGEIARRLEPVLFQQAQYLISQLRPWEQDEEALLLTKGGSGEHDIRPNAHTASGLAMLYRCVPKEHYPAGLSPDFCLEKAIRILRFLLSTHRAGGKFCANERQWHSQWQSALWATSVGSACWLLWDDLPHDLRWLASRMVTEEADRFVGVTPPAQVKNDTKAEENAWNSEVISLAFNMFPKHPHHEAWRETAIRWAVTSFAREHDLTSDDLVDGRPLSEWLTAANIHDDYTLENHARVHPDYMNTIDTLLTQIRFYDWADNPHPQALEHNVRGIYANLKALSFPDAGYLYPNGQDWHLHRCPDWFRTHVIQAVLYNDRQAARLARLSLETIERMAARNPDGALFRQEEFFFASTQHMFFELASKAYLIMRAKGEGAKPISEKRLWQQLTGTYHFKSGEFAVLRTPSSVSSFSWGARIMGMTLPLQKDLLLTPYESSMLGALTVDSVRHERSIIKDVRYIELDNGFAVLGIASRAEGAVEQRFGFVARSDERSVYVDRLYASPDAQIDALELGTIGIANEPHWIYHRGVRTLSFQRTKEHITGAGLDETPFLFSCPWFNVDNVLGIVCLEGSGNQSWIPIHRYQRGRLQQLFVLNHYDERTLPIREENGLVAETALVFYPGQPHRKTRKAASRCQYKVLPEDRFSICLEDGTSIEFDLNELSINVPGAGHRTH